LSVPEWDAVSYRFRLIYRRDTSLGPAARWLIERFVAQTPKQPVSA
jgi:DNA-binding transcriptional LysR family regulator